MRLKGMGEVIGHKGEEQSDEVGCVGQVTAIPTDMPHPRWSGRRGWRIWVERGGNWRKGGIVPGSWVQCG